MAADLVADPADQRIHQSCVLTAVQPGSRAQADPQCRHLRGAAQGCTAYLGHLIQVLDAGTDDPEDVLTLGQLARAVRQEIRDCKLTYGTRHPEANILPNGLGDDVRIFENRRPVGERRRPRPESDASLSPVRWADELVAVYGRAASIADAVTTIVRVGPELTAQVLHEVEVRDFQGRNEIMDKLIDGAVGTFDATGRAQFMMLLGSQRVA